MATIGYVTDQDLVDYAAARGVTITLGNAPIFLTRALDWMTAQNLTVPDPVPAAIEQAQLACGLIYAEGGDPMAPIAPQVTQERVEGAVSVSYSDKGPSMTLYPLLMSLIAPYRTGGTGIGAGFAVSRA